MRYKHSDIKKVSPIEPVCRKTIYNSREEAQDMIKHIMENRVIRQISAYKCSVCGFWHLTSKG
jgi:lipopolysaccharide biosynthesis regulator YciM